MDQERERIQDDLRGLVAGDVRCDDLFLEMYASDASVYEIKPLGLICPRHAADVVACVQYAEENEPLIHFGVGDFPGSPELVLVCHLGSDQLIEPAAFHEHLDHGDTRGGCGE